MQASELIRNADGSIYHLALRPEHLRPIVLTVGDPQRVGLVAQHFDQIDYRIEKREFVSCGGRIGNKAVMVISTGIGSDNIDIVLNELDALAHLNLDTGAPLDNPQTLQFIRIGTSGALHADLEVDTFLTSSMGLGMDGLLLFYPDMQPPSPLKKALQQHLNEALPLPIYLEKADDYLLQQAPSHFHQGITATAPGFYAPQGRNIRAGLAHDDIRVHLQQFAHEDFRVTNLEMETAAIYGLAHRLGHRAISFNALLANRATETFSSNPKATTLRLIEEVLTWVSEL